MAAATLAENLTATLIGGREADCQPDRGSDVHHGPPELPPELRPRIRLKYLIGCSFVPTLIWRQLRMQMEMLIAISKNTTAWKEMQIEHADPDADSDSDPDSIWRRPAPECQNPDPFLEKCPKP